MLDRSSIRLLVFVLLVSVESRSALAQTLWEPQSLTTSQRVPRPTVRWEIVTAILVAEVTVSLENTTLDDVAARFRASKGASGTGSEYLQWICLVSKGQDGPWLAWFISESDGGVVRGFLLRRLASGERADPRCGELLDGDTPLTAPVNVQLGMNRAETMALGQPSSTSGDVVEYVHEHTLRRRSHTSVRGEPLLSSNNVVIRFRQGVIDAIQAWKSIGP